FLEAPHMKFGDEPMNDEWIAVNYGATMTEKLKGTRISCCGTVMGTQMGMIDYLEVFIAEIRRLKSVAHGADTSIHNVLVRDVLAKEIAIAENFLHAVGTINPAMMTGLVPDAEGRVL